MSSQSLRQEEKERSIAQLREWIKDGDTVYTVLRHVSRSGMKRIVSVVLILPQENGLLRPVILHPNFHVAEACGFRIQTGFHDGIVMGGCGMDMGFHLVDSLRHALGYKSLRQEWL